MCRKPCLKTLHRHPQQQTLLSPAGSASSPHPTPVHGDSTAPWQHPMPHRAQTGNWPSGKRNVALINSPPSPAPAEAQPHTREFPNRGIHLCHFQKA